ncbi:TonB-dependent receptor [Cellvibrio sp. NN19]|uniref:TonB-dependent receptor n=1 Tax=Cellvibrio chitinivorans TaxID=3102792 RepID=UPI002B40690B|nr:TonB-dependent receptor [Cellvibrio sp. NN19]
MIEYANSSRFFPLPIHIRNAAVQSVLIACASLGLATVAVPAAFAQTPEAAQAIKTYRITGGSLESALLAFAGQAGVNLMLDSTRLAGLTSAGISGSFSVDEGFSRLLENTSLQIVKLDANSYTIREKPVPVATESLQKVVVTARTESEIVEPSRSITLIEKEELDKLRQGSNDLADLLGKAIAGMAGSTQTITEYGQTLRGREALILVDGVPLNTNRGSSRNLANINLANVEQIEVVRGSSSIYGSGATGGIISIRTRQPAGESVAQTTVTGIVPLSELTVSGLGGELQHYTAGAKERVDYTLNLGARHVGGSYDAKGNRIAPEPSQGDMFDSTIYTAAAKLGFKIDANQRVQLSASYYDLSQDTEFATDPSVAALPPNSVPARALKGLELEEQNTVENTMLGLDYEHRNILGGSLAAQIYYRDFFTRFAPFDARNVSVRGANVDQSMQNSEVYGGRLTIKSPIGESKSTQLVWGGDIHNEVTDMPLDIFDPQLYDASGGLVFKKIGKIIYMPEVTTETSGVFAQLEHRFSEKLSLEAGARFDVAEASFDDFIPLSQSRLSSPATVVGGAIDYDDWTFNAGGVYTLTKAHELYASFNQGFQLPDIGLQVRNATPAFNIDNSDLQAVKTDTTELGWRGRWSSTLANLSVFESRSDLGGVQSFNNGLRLARTKERIYGLEGSVDYFSSDDSWATGATMTWMKGEERPQNSAQYQDMPGNRIPPLKFTAYGEYRPSEKWNHRLQLTAFKGKDYRLNGVASFGRRDTEGYAVVDLISQWKISEVSKVDVGVENLFNTYYYPQYSQLLRSSSNTSHLPASGTVLKLGFTHNW